MNITYQTNTCITIDQFIGLLKASTLGARRPVDNRECMEGMLSNANLTITARHEDKLVGIARSVTDFYYCCYLSDLAVHEAYQKQGVGKRLLREIRQQLKPSCRLILLSAPAAVYYYPRLGFEKHPQAWTLTGDQ
jgi:GNAT superfamily N-acetyltransferase